MFNDASVRRIASAVRKVERGRLSGVIRRGRFDASGFPFDVVPFWGYYDVDKKKMVVNAGCVVIHGPAGATRIEAIKKELDLPTSDGEVIVYVLIDWDAETAVIAIAEAADVPTDDEDQAVFWLQSYDVEEDSETGDAIATLTAIHNMCDIEIIPKQAEE